MTKIVYNACYGGFSLSHKAIMRYAELKGIKLYCHKETGFSFNHYTTVPWEEYERINEEERMNLLSPDRFARSNGLYFSDRDIERNDPALAQVVEELGDAANGAHAKLQIADVPEGTLYRIDEYDGYESVMTQDDYEWKIA